MGAGHCDDSRNDQKLLPGQSFFSPAEVHHQEHAKSDARVACLLEQPVPTFDTEFIQRDQNIQPLVALRRSRLAENTARSTL